MNMRPTSGVTGKSLLSREHFQVAYVTNDLARATTVLGERYGIADYYYIRDVQPPFGGRMDIALAWAGNINIEIIQASGNRESFYERRLPQNEFAIAFHHLGYRVAGAEEWRQLLADVERTGHEIVYGGSDPSGLDFIYIEVPELGHYLEWIWPRQAWIDLFNSVPRN